MTTTKTKAKTARKPRALKADIAPVDAAAVDQQHRTITGLIVPFGETGYASNGPTVFSAGTITTPHDLDRVKLLVQHDTYAVALGYMTDYEETDAGAVATFHLPDGDDADAALKAAQDGTRDGLTVGVMITDYSYADDGNTIQVVAAELREVSLVTVPAFQSAKVTHVTAALTDPNKEHIMNTHPTADGATTAAATPPAKDDAAQPATTAFSADQVASFAAIAQAITAANTGQVTPPAHTEKRPIDLHAAAVQFAEGYRQGRNPFELAAALNDVIPTNDAGNGFLSGDVRPQWAGELWQASRVARPLIDAAGSPKPLTGVTVTGWKYDLDNLPGVDDYAGDKAAIPSSNIKTVTQTVDVTRKAGGWDIDRVFVDLGDPSIIEAILTKSTDDYKTKTETDVRTALVAAATAVTAGSTFAGTLAALGAQAVKIGSQLSAVVMSPDQWLAFAELTESDVPWWLRSQGELNLGTTSGSAGGISFSSAPELADGTIIAVDGRAYTYYEKSPIQVQALNIPNGGVDVGVFGYQALIINDPRAILKVTAADGGTGA